MKYIKRVEPIEAVQWNGTGRYDVIICAYRNAHGNCSTKEESGTGQVSIYTIRTRCGLQEISIGDWVIDDGKYNDVISDKYFQENYVPYE